MIDQRHTVSCVKFQLRTHMPSSKNCNFQFCCDSNLSSDINCHSTSLICDGLCDILDYFQCFCIFPAQIRLVMNELMCPTCIWKPNPYMHDFWRNLPTSTVMAGVNWVAMELLGVQKTSDSKWNNLVFLCVWIICLLLSILKCNTVYAKITHLFALNKIQHSTSSNVVHVSIFAKHTTE